MPSNWEEERKAIESYFANNWDYSAIPVKYENSIFIQPGTHNTIRQPWVALFIHEITGGRINIGDDNPLRRYIGSITVQIFTDPNIGTGRARQIASDIADVWRDVTFSCGTTGRITIGGHHDGSFATEPQIIIVGDNGTGWYQVNVYVRYRRDDFI